jgi:HSP20 family protein
MPVIRFVADSPKDRRSSASGQGDTHAKGTFDWYAPRGPRIWRPPTDVYETDEHVIVKVEIAGVGDRDFDISFADRRLVIAGVRAHPEGKLIYQNMEIHYGEFRTEVRLDWALEQAGITADYEEGFLFVRLPKAREYRVPIKTRQAEG